MQHLRSLVENDLYFSSHGGTATRLGGLAVIYSLACCTELKLAVVIGSGQGAVPKILKQAQLDCKVEGKVTVVDVGISAFPGNGEPNYLATGLGDIEIIREYANKVASRFDENSIDYLHIDHDHRLEATVRDSLLWVPKVKPTGLITIHDTSNSNAYCQVKEGVEMLKGMLPLEVLDLPWVGTGMAIMRRLG